MGYPESVCPSPSHTCMGVMRRVEHQAKRTVLYCAGTLCRVGDVRHHFSTTDVGPGRREGVSLDIGMVLRMGCGCPAVQERLLLGDSG